MSNERITVQPGPVTVRLSQPTALTTHTVWVETQALGTFYVGGGASWNSTQWFLNGAVATPAVPFYVHCDTEVMKVTQVITNGTAWTELVVAQFATTGLPQAHAAGAQVYVARPQTVADQPTLLGRAMLGSTDGLNNQAGWQNGNFQRIMLQEGAFTLTFPNRDAQGQYWRDRFMITNPNIAYRPGDEWIEIYQDRELVYVGTPTKATVDSNQVQITGWDSFWMLKRTREFDLGWWWDDPQSVLYHYSQAWRTLIADPCLAGEPNPGRSLVASSGASATLTSSGVVLTAPAGASANNSAAGPNGAQCWRAETTFTINSFAGTPTVYMQVNDSADVYTLGLTWSSSGQPTITVSTDTYSSVVPANLSGVPVGITQQVVMERRYDYVTVFLNGYIIGVLNGSRHQLQDDASAALAAAGQIVASANQTVQYDQAAVNLINSDPVMSNAFDPQQVAPGEWDSLTEQILWSAATDKADYAQTVQQAVSAFVSASLANPANANGAAALQALSRAKAPQSYPYQDQSGNTYQSYPAARVFLDAQTIAQNDSGSPVSSQLVAAMGSVINQNAATDSAIDATTSAVNTLITANQNTAAGQLSLATEVYGGPSGSSINVTQTSALIRVLQPFLMDQPVGTPLIDTPPTGGLAGIFIDRSNYQTLSPTADTTKLMMAPDVPQDGVTYGTPGAINFNTGTSSWVPPGCPVWWFMARFTGAIWLDLANHDYQLQVQVDGNVRLWVGRTVGVANALIDQQNHGTGGYFTTVSLRSVLGRTSGWYPIRLDYAMTNLNSWWLVLAQSVDGGAQAAVPGSSLSPYGCYTTQIRRQSHYDAFQQVASAFGYQYATEPKRLESGQFPGRIQWGERIGRDTDKVLDEIEGQAWQVQLDAEACSDAVQADASGIPDPSGLQQLSGEAFNMPEMGTHMFPITDYQSMSDITDRGLLQQRLQQYLILESSPWEQVGVTPPGYREARNGFQLTGDLAEFNWEPGDGIRLNLPTIGVIDESPRQITSVTRDITPDGCKPPQVAFRDRPRSLAQLIRNMQQTTLNYQRSYQGQVKWVTGSLGGTSGAADAYSRLIYTGEILRCYAHICIGGGSGWVLEVDSVSTGLTLSTGYASTLDITRWLTSAASNVQGLHWAQLTGGTGTYQMFLTAQMRG